MVAVLAIGAVVLLLTVTIAPDLSTLTSISRSMKTAKPFLVCLHFFLIAALWWKWSALVDWGISRGKIGGDVAIYVRQQRNRVALTLIVVELFFVVQLPWLLFDLLR